MILQTIRQTIEKALREAGLPATSFALEHPRDMGHGDYATNAALVLAKSMGENPQALAERIAAKITELGGGDIESAEAAGPGFINIRLSRAALARNMGEILEQGDAYGKSALLKGQKTIIEYTDANPFKELHIGHLMSNTIGESLSRILAAHGAEVKRANYEGDVGMHVAKAVWGILKKKDELPKETGALGEKTAFLGKCYALGAAAFEDAPQAKEEIVALNKKIYERTDKEVNKLYDMGRAWSLASFEELYKRLGTTFDFYFFESEVWQGGRELVEAHIADGVFEKSDGAIVYKGENEGLHTRVFINAQGLPTYEAKDLRLAHYKYEKYRYDASFIVTASEVTDYFKVVLAALGKISPALAAKTRHIPHGFLRLPTGKMSSRTGNVITGEGLLNEVKERISSVMHVPEGVAAGELEHTKDAVAVGALKYAILKQAMGQDIIFDFDATISFEGDSGPYLQYTYARARAVCRKARELGIKASLAHPVPEPPLVERLLHRLPEAMERAGREYAPHHIVHALLAIAGSYNSLYAGTKFAEEGNADSPYYVALSEAVAQVLKTGLWLLGIEAPERM
jgi:arginyl-tRNA synthetase